MSINEIWYCFSILGKFVLQRYAFSNELQFSHTLRGYFYVYMQMCMHLYMCAHTHSICLKRCLYIITSM